MWSAVRGRRTRSTRQCSDIQQVSPKIRRNQNQRKIIRVDPDNTELWVVGVVSRYVFENLQKLVAVWEQQRRSVNSVQGAKDNRKPIGKGPNQDLPPLQKQQCVFHPNRPPRRERLYDQSLCFEVKYGKLAGLPMFQTYSLPEASSALPCEKQNFMQHFHQVVTVTAVTFKRKPNYPNLL